MLPSTRLHGPQHGAHDRTADADDGNHDNEPTDGDGLRHHYSTAGLGLLLGRVMLPPRGPARPGTESKHWLVQGAVAAALACFKVRREE
jgi:hypothetical protein